MPGRCLLLIAPINRRLFIKNQNVAATAAKNWPEYANNYNLPAH